MAVEKKKIKKEASDKVTKKKFIFFLCAEVKTGENLRKQSTSGKYLSLPQVNAGLIWVERS